jgi:2-octaprenyl-6-methoxyphenol hydroxylase
MDRRRYDVVIIGGGMVGASLALLLPETLDILVLESVAIPEDTSLAHYQPSYDARSTALSWGSRRIFDNVGIWPVLQKHAEPILDVHVSDRGHWGSAHMSHDSEHWEALGYVVENTWLGRSLMHVMQKKPNIRFCCPATVSAVKITGDGAQVMVQQHGQQHCIEAVLAIVADGAQSAVCRMLGIHHRVEDYGHTAIVANVSTARPHHGIAYERFTDSGPLALLPLPATGDDPQRSALIWTLPHKQADALLTSNDAEFLTQLQSRFGNWQGRFCRVGQRSSYRLKLSTAEEQVRSHLVVLGNAAHSLHPVAGQGFNLALRDVQVLADLLRSARVSQQSIADLAVLKQYLQQQQADQYLTSLFSDVLPSLFANPSLLVKAGRNIGLLGLELLPPLKSSLLRFAAGVRY